MRSDHVKPLGRTTKPRRRCPLFAQ